MCLPYPVASIRCFECCEVTIFGDDAKSTRSGHVNYGLKAQAVDEEQLIPSFLPAASIPIRNKALAEERNG